MPPELFSLYLIVLNELKDEGNQAALLVTDDLNMRQWAENIYNNEWPKSSLGYTVKSRAQARIVLHRIRHGPVEGS